MMDFVLSFVFLLSIVAFLVFLVWMIVALVAKKNKMISLIGMAASFSLFVITFILLPSNDNAQTKEGEAQEIEKVSETYYLPSENDYTAETPLQNEIEGTNDGNDGNIDDDNTLEQEIDSMDDNVKEPVTGVEVTKMNPPISNFSYHTYDDLVVLERYKGNDEIVDIFPTYEIDSVTYKTDLSEFMIGLFNSTAKTVIFEEGITEVYGPIFNSCDVQSVYFPLSMELVYDNTLSYLHPETGRIKIYYAGTQEQWGNIFTEYTRTLVSEAEFGGEMGTALADAVNSKFGSSYDSSEFAYYFESSPDDLR